MDYNGNGKVDKEDILIQEEIDANRQNKQNASMTAPAIVVTIIIVVIIVAIKFGR